MNLDKKIDKLGREIVRCRLECDGVDNEPSKGILPRCLYFDDDGKGKKGVIVVGLNPGRAEKSEISRLKKKDHSYSRVKEDWEDNFKNKGYYKKTRELLLGLGFKGPIIWTELVKCQCDKKHRTIPLKTRRVCVNKFLKREMSIYPNYLVFCLGNDAFTYCSILFPDRPIIGIPHPTGSHGNFHDLSEKIKRNPSKYMELVKKVKRNLLAKKLSDK